MTTFTVRSNAELTDILSRIDGLGGGTIKLEADGGPYEINARGLGSSGSPVTITAADPANPPVVESLYLRDASHVSVSGLHFEGKEKGEIHSIYVMGSDNITLSGNTMVGVATEFASKTNGALQGNGAMLLRDSSQITVSDNTISNYGDGIGILEIDGLVIEGNEISQMQGDGIRGGGIRNAEINDNHFHDFLGTTQSINHSDMIQLWGTNAQSVTENVTISGNLLDTGNGALSQGIFIRNEEFGRGSAPENGYFKNITITDNVVHNAAHHGIAVADVNGLVIRSNTLLKNEAAYMFNDDGSPIPPAEPRYQVTNSLNVTGFDNIGSQYLGQISDTGNTVLVYDNPTDPMYVGNHIVNLSGQGDTDLSDLQIRIDSPLWGTAGAEMTSLLGEASGDLGPVISTAKVDENALARILDASATMLPEGTGVAWHFADGSIREGLTIQHVFTTPGHHDVTLVITQPDGTTTSSTRRLEIDDPYLFAFDFAAGAADITTRGIEAQVTGTDAQAFVSTPQDKGFSLNPNTGLVLGRENAQLFGLEAFNIDLRFQQTQAMEDGGLLGIHTVFKLDIEKDGALSFWLRTEDGDFKITTDAGVMNTTDWQDIGVRYDGPAGTLELLVNGTVMASGAATGATTGPLSWGLELGRPWGENATGIFESVSMSLPHDATPGSDQISPDPEGETGEIAAPPLPEDPEPEVQTLLDVDFSEGGRDVSDYASQLNDPTNGAGFTTGREGAGFAIGGDTNIYVDNSATQIFGQTAFDIGFDFRKDSADDHGGLLNQQKTLDLKIREDMGLRLVLKTDEGHVRFRTEAGVMDDTEWHRINIRYDSDDALVEIIVDGQTMASASLSGRTADVGRRDFVIGDPWHDSAAGVVDNLEITRPATPEEMATMTASASASAMAPLFAQLDAPEDADNAPMSNLDGTSSLAQVWDQGGIDALSNNGQVPEPLMPI